MVVDHLRPVGLLVLEESGSVLLVVSEVGVEGLELLGVGVHEVVAETGGALEV